MTQRRWQVLSLGSFGKWVSWENERDGEEGREMQACRMLFEEKQLGDGTGALLPTVWLPCERSSNKLADRTAQWADVAHIQLDGWMHNSRVVYTNQISPGSWRTCSFMQHEFPRAVCIRLTTRDLAYFVHGWGCVWSSHVQLMLDCNVIDSQSLVQHECLSQHSMGP